MFSRPPGPALRPFVKTLWASDESALRDGAPRELVLPTGGMHVVVRVSDTPLRIFDGEGDATGHTLAHAVVGGPRSSFYVRDVSRPVCSVGAQLYPGAAELVLGVPADALAERHTALEDLWGLAASEARERLAEAGSARARVDVFEAILTARLPRIRGLHPAVAHALSRLSADVEVREVVDESGYSHRRFIELFRHAVGLPPKLYSRVLRFQRVISRLDRDPRVAWAALASEVGYSDQAHLSREFREIAGVTPTRYRQLAPPWSHHVPIKVSPKANDRKAR